VQLFGAQYPEVSSRAPQPPATVWQLFELLFGGGVKMGARAGSAVLGLISNKMPLADKILYAAVMLLGLMLLGLFWCLPALALQVEIVYHAF
jgi:hypothetical protein